MIKRWRILSRLHGISVLLRYPLFARRVGERLLFIIEIPSKNTIAFFYGNTRKLLFESAQNPFEYSLLSRTSRKKSFSSFQFFCTFTVPRVVSSMTNIVSYILANRSIQF